MSSPLKLASSLLFSKRIVSPISPKLLSPCYGNKDNRRSLPVYGKQQNKIFLKDCNDYETVNNRIKIKLTEPGLEEGLIINSPNKLDMLKHGLNKHSLLYAIGKGSFGTVLKGKYKGNLVAVKIIRLDKPLERINEQNARHLFHENIIKIIDIVGNGFEKFALILMEYYDNSRNLQLVLDDSDFSLTRPIIIKFSKDIVNGVKYCHDNDILHLDIKPKNILLCNNTCKICDFGNSVRESEAIPIYNYRGTVAYAAPEILKGEKPSSKSDIYSLGILFWQFMSRKSPYESTDNEVVIYKVVKFNLRPNTSQIKQMEDFLKLCFICWKGKPADRPEASEVLLMLNNFN